VHGTGKLGIICGFLPGTRGLSKIMASKKILVTTGLPYANGPLHLGHILEQIIADIWVRVKRELGNTCHFVCGEDAHGTPVMLKAEAKGVKPSELAAQFQEQHANSSNKFNICFDNFHTTHSPENAAILEAVYKKLVANDDISERETLQAFDAAKGMFLPDRFIKGTCPKCGAENQHGDSCDVCGATYSTTELVNPVSVLSNTTPITKNSLHYFFKLPKYTEFLSNWLNSGSVQPEVANKLQEWLKSGLIEWDIARDAPYFGFPLPGIKDKYFYVWLDAPFGYMASFKNLCQRDSKIDFDEYWNSETTELHHFIGKDIVYFHTLFWPAILQATGYRNPTSVKVHGFLTVDGTKMSKSKGNFIMADAYAKHLDTECLRYYFAAKVSSGIEDIDFNLNDFILRVNADLVGKFINIGSRCAAFVNKQFDSLLADELPELNLWHEFQQRAADTIYPHYESLNFSKAIREVMLLADKANKYIDTQKPWQMIKTDPKLAHKVCSLGLNLFRLLALYLQPVVPRIAGDVGSFLQQEKLTVESCTKPLIGVKIAKYEPLLQRITKQQVDQMMEDTKVTETTSNVEKSESNFPAIKPEIDFADFAKCDLRIGKIIAAENVPEADKLLKLRIDVGDSEKQVFAGIKAFVTPESLIGKHTLVIVNLKPRKMRFGLSEGMLLVASGETGLYLLEPHTGAVAGMQVS